MGGIKVRKLLPLVWGLRFFAPCCSRGCGAGAVGVGGGGSRGSGWPGSAGAPRLASPRLAPPQHRAPPALSGKRQGSANASPAPAGR